MASTRTVKNFIGLAASVLLCGAIGVAQTQIGAPGSPDPGNTGGNMGPQSGTTSGTTSRSPSMGSQGDMQGASNMKGGSAADKEFVRKAMEGDMAEIQLGQLAQQKASSPDVKQFGERMVTDHTKLDDQIKPIAQQLGVSAPTKLSAKHQAVATKLQGLSGDAFDKAYISAMVSDHRTDDQEFKREKSSAKDPALKDAVTQAEPIIADHLRMAEGLQNGAQPTGVR